MSGKIPSATHIGGGNGAGGTAFGETGIGGTAFGEAGIGGGTAFGAAGGRGVAVETGTGPAAGVGGTSGIGAGVTNGPGPIGRVAAIGGVGGVAQYQRTSLRCSRCAISMRSDRAGFTQRLAGYSSSSRRIVSIAPDASCVWFRLCASQN